MNTYAGIGSRCTPADVLALMERVATALSTQGWTLRSGHADGADQAFERGAMGQAEIFLPWSSFNQQVPVRGRRFDRPSLDAVALAQEIHPFGNHLSARALALHARNSHQVLGPELDDPVKFVLCWAPSRATNGYELGAGGTGQALRIAWHRKIQVFNLGIEEHRGWVEEWIGASPASLVV